MPLQMYNYTYIINNKFHSADKRHIFKKSVQLVFIRRRTRVKYYFFILKIIAFLFGFLCISISFNQKYN